MIDTHCHLNYDPLATDVAGVLERARAAGVDRVIVPGTSRETSDSAVELAGQFDTVWAGVGIHPSDAHTATEADLERIRTLMLNPRVVAVGEVGLDYFHFEGLSDDEISARKAMQQALLREMIALACEHDKPLIIHSRDCFNDLYDILKRDAIGMKVVVHCFTGTADEAQAWLDLGFYLSVTGIITYKNATSLREVVSTIPWERLMVETDAPYLTPLGFKGQSCEPSMVVSVAEMVAGLKQVSITEADERTTSTAERFFTLHA